MISRRTFLANAAAGAGAITIPWIWVPAAAATESKLVEAYQGKRGITLTLELAHGMFPSPGSRWKDATTFVFVPHHYRLPKDRKIDTVLHFHGHHSTAESHMKEHQLREQFYDSKQNAILVMPQGPVRAGTGDGGKLDKERGLLRFLTDLRKMLQSRSVRRECGRAAIQGHARIGQLMLSAHSGGYRVAAQCLKHGGFPVQETYLFDALYGNVGDFYSWMTAKKGDRKIVCYYTGGKVGGNCRRLQSMLEKEGIGCRHEKKEGTLTRAEFTKARAVFIRTRTGHGDATHELNSFRDCLFASCLKRRLRSQWFDNKDKARRLERRTPE